jgi:transcriptional regulator with XRE-family HTH domain
MRMWGALLRRFRLAAGVTHDQLAAHVGYSASLVIAIERGRRMPSPTFITKADECVKADGWLIDAAQHLSRERIADTIDAHEEEEARARSVWAYDTHVLHPLLRTEAYSRAVLWAQRPVLSDHEIEMRIKAEHERQTRLTSEPVCSYSFIIEEWILHRKTGGPTAMKAQSEHLLCVADLRNVTLQVIPTTHEAHAGLSGPVILLHAPEHTWLAHIELHGTHHLISDPDHLTTLHDRYTHLRSLALTPADSAELIRGLADALQE